MSRVERYKLCYIAAILLLLVIVVGGNFAAGGSVASLMVVALLLLIPGRIQGHIFRELLRGRRLLDSGDPEGALAHLRRFEALLRDGPWRKKLQWLSFSVYTPDVEAMTHNNIGAAHLELGNLDQAEASFGAAVTLDPLYPIPHLNIAIIRELQGDRAGAEKAAETARELGYKGGTLDQVMRSAQSLLATVEGRGGAR